MLANMSIKTKILVLSIITIILVSLSIAVNSIYSINKLSQENINNSTFAPKTKQFSSHIS